MVSIIEPVIRVYKKVKTSNSEEYKRLAEIILEQALKDNVLPHTRLPSERELAERFMRSRMAIRKGLDYLKQEGCIMSRQGYGNYWVKFKADLANLSKPFRVCYIGGEGAFVSEFSNMLDGLSNYPSHHPVLTTTFRLNHSFSHHIETIPQLNDYDGYILTGDFIQSDIDYLLNFRRPLVLWGTPIDNPLHFSATGQLSWIKVDNRTPWNLAMDSLIARGYSHPVFLVATRHQAYFDRQQGILNSLLAHHLPIENCTMVIADNSSTFSCASPRAIWNSVLDMMRNISKYDCILSTVQPWIFGTAAIACGMNPHTLPPMVCETNYPDLSSYVFNADIIAQNSNHVGALCAKILLELLEGRSGHTLNVITPRLVSGKVQDLDAMPFDNNKKCMPLNHTTN